MSKIEEALKKARSMQGLEEASLPISPETSLARRSDITRMREPRVRSTEELEAFRIIHPGMKNRRVLNAFRHLRTTVQQAAAPNNSVLSVTATLPRGGGTFVALNLGATIALDEYHSVIIVDCNLEKPALDYLSLEAHDDGLVDYLQDETMPLERIIHATGIPRLRVVPAGSRHSAHREYFSLPRFHRLIRELKQRYADRQVILDTPSASQSADARLAAEVADFTLIVVPYARTTEAQVDSAVEQIGQEKVLGALINDEPSSTVLKW